MVTPHAPSNSRDRGFTLVELLIVIVILGVLAVVAVFAVRGITDDGEQNAASADVRILDTAINAYEAREGDMPTEQDLVDKEYLTGQSTLHNFTTSSDGSYTITDATTGEVVASRGTTTPTSAPGTTTPPSGDPIAGTAITIGGVPAHAVGTGANSAVFIGGVNTRTVWNAAISAGRTVRPSGVPGGDRLIFIDSSQINGLDALRAVAAREGIDFDTAWTVDADDTPSFCEIPGSPDPIRLKLSQCVTQARIDAGKGFAEQVWELQNVDPLFSPLV